jgi:hypothetical protein
MQDQAGHNARQPSLFEDPGRREGVLANQHFGELGNLVGVVGEAGKLRGVGGRVDVLDLFQFDGLELTGRILGTHHQLLSEGGLYATTDRRRPAGRISKYILQAVAGFHLAERPACFVEGDARRT